MIILQTWRACPRSILQVGAVAQIKEEMGRWDSQRRIAEALHRLQSRLTSGQYEPSKTEHSVTTSTIGLACDMHLVAQVVAEHFKGF